MKRKPIVAIVGRPNVGKSTLVNRLIGHRNSIVDDRPGVTRDRIYFDVEWQNKLFTVIDTGGIVPGDEDEIMLSIYDQAKIACDEADKIIFVVDGKDGVHPVDEDIANILRQSDKPVFVAFLVVVVTGFVIVFTSCFFCVDICSGGLLSPIPVIGVLIIVLM